MGDAGDELALCKLKASRVDAAEAHCAQLERRIADLEAFLVHSRPLTSRRVFGFSASGGLSRAGATGYGDTADSGESVSGERLSGESVSGESVRGKSVSGESEPVRKRARGSLGDVGDVDVGDSDGSADGGRAGGGGRDGGSRTGAVLDVAANYQNAEVLSQIETSETERLRTVCSEQRQYIARLESSLDAFKASAKTGSSASWAAAMAGLVAELEAELVAEQAWQKHGTAKMAAETPSRSGSSGVETTALSAAADRADQSSSYAALPTPRDVQKLFVRLRAELQSARSARAEAEAAEIAASDMLVEARSEAETQRQAARAANRRADALQDEIAERDATVDSLRKDVANFRHLTTSLTEERSVDAAFGKQLAETQEEARRLRSILEAYDRRQANRQKQVETEGAREGETEGGEGRPGGEQEERGGGEQEEIENEEGQEGVDGNEDGYGHGYGHGYRDEDGGGEESRSENR